MAHKKQKIVICYILPAFTTGGAEKLVLSYAASLDTRIYDIHVMSMVGGGELLSAFQRIPGVSVFVGDRATQGGRLGVYRAAKEYLLRVQPDIIHSHLFGGDFWGYAVQQALAKKPLWLVTLHNTEEATSRVRKWIWKTILQRADRVIAVSSAVAAYSQQTFSLAPEQLMAVENGIPLDTLLAISAKQPGAVLQLATIGRLTTQKGHEYVLEALSQLRSYPWQLHVYGTGELGDRLKKLAQVYGIADHVVWHDVVSDMPRVYAHSDVVIQPSLWEGMSLVVMEAMAAGKCIIASGAAAEGLITHEETGYVVSPLSASALAKQIESVFLHPQDIVSLGVHARAYAQEHFDLRDHLQKIEQLYQE